MMGFEKYGRSDLAVGHSYAWFDRNCFSAIEAIFRPKNKKNAQPVARILVVVAAGIPVIPEDLEGAKGGPTLRC